MDTSGWTRGLRAAVNKTAGWRTVRAWAHVGASLAMIATALSGCASLALEQAIGHDPREYPPVVEAYEWAGRRGDEVVVVYRVWGGHPRRHETRWTALDLRTAAWAAGLAATRVGALGDRPGPIPERDSTERSPWSRSSARSSPRSRTPATTTAQRGMRRSRSTRAAGRPPS